MDEVADREVIESSTPRLAEFRNVIRDALALTELPYDSTFYKNCYENRIMEAIMHHESTDE